MALFIGAKRVGTLDSADANINCCLLPCTLNTPIRLNLLIRNIYGNADMFYTAMSGGSIGVREYRNIIVWGENVDETVALGV